MVVVERGVLGRNFKELRGWWLREIREELVGCDKG